MRRLFLLKLPDFLSQLMIDIIQLPQVLLHFLQTSQTKSFEESHIRPIDQTLEDRQKERLTSY
jgi:hypothetical protein